MKIGLFFGSFNPIHNGHLIIASHILNNINIEKIWFVVSPQNPLKNSKGLLNQYQRLNLVQLAIHGDDRMLASDIEFKMPKPSYTIDTLQILTEKYPQHNFVIIMGSDSYSNLEKWKNYSELKKRFEIVVYTRPGFNISNNDNEKLTIITANLIDISATHIRSLIRDKKNIRYLLPDVVVNEIEAGHYYL